MYKREGPEFAEEQHGIVVRASWSVVSTMEQYDGERVVAQVAIAILLRRMMQYREPMNVSRGSVSSLLFEAAAVSPNGAHRQRRVTLQIKNRIQTRERERESRRILVCQESSIKCESKKQVSRSRSRKHQCMNTKNDTSVESDQNVTTQA